jgi:hypothetical protein
VILYTQSTGLHENDFNVHAQAPPSYDQMGQSNNTDGIDIDGVNVRLSRAPALADCSNLKFTGLAHNFQVDPAV